MEGAADGTDAVIEIAAGGSRRNALLHTALALLCQSVPGIGYGNGSEAPGRRQATVGQKGPPRRIIDLYPTGEGEGTLIDQQQPIWVTSSFASPTRALVIGTSPEWLSVSALCPRSLDTATSQLAHGARSTNIAAIEAAVAAGLAVAVLRQGSVDLSRLRALVPEDGFTPLARADVRLQAADRFLSRATVELRDFLLDKLLTDQLARSPQ
ncbi:hypothetical protein QTH87_06510 [Variovorax sp. J22P168]|uniref:hypothetical protein n=1 Tax=Variovorax jilinensis TaxID=3053513 RepID=UPI00257563F2|nr:hypothetical protein [Variovorax sp. J22P168]MDM0012091.1 hypothetical protein [Variovorax sp. J22P168]